MILALIQAKRTMRRGASGSPEPKTIYRHKAGWFCLLFALFILATAVHGLVQREHPLLAAFMIPWAFWFYLMGHVLRIVVSPDGIEYHNMGFYTIRSSWGNVERMTSVTLGRRTIPCLRLRRSEVSGWTGCAWILDPTERGRTIPLSNGWAEAERLRAQVRKYAPQLRGRAPRKTGVNRDA